MGHVRWGKRGGEVEVRGSSCPPGFPACEIPVGSAIKCPRGAGSGRAVRMRLPAALALALLLSSAVPGCGE